MILKNYVNVKKVLSDENTYYAFSEILNKSQRLLASCKVKLSLPLSDTADGMHVFALLNRLEPK